MDRKVFSFLIFLIYVKQEAYLAITVRKFNHQKDMSEYCRRRVAPSVFLGKQVMEASSRIMHFSQLDLPYSCTLNVRTESGNNIILVIQLISKMGLMDSCAENANQLIIYELGETFGGYWGHLPDRMIKKTTKNNYTRFYTLKTTTATTPKSTKDETDEPQKLFTQNLPVAATDRPQDFIRMEVPLVNVSGNFQLGSPLQTDNADEMFDFIYDVTPKAGVEYETSVLPLVQFSIKKQKVGKDMEQRYDLNYAVDGFTFDSRLLFSTVNRRMTTGKKKWSSSRRLNFRKKNVHKLFTPRSTSYYIKSRSFTKAVAPTLNSSVWVIEDLMKAFNMSTMRSTVNDNTTMRNILHKISNIDHNISVYLAPNLSIYENSNIFSNEENLKSVKTTDFDFTTKSSLSTDLRKTNNLLRNKKLNNFKFTENQRFTLQTDVRVNKSSYSNSLELKMDEYQSTKINGLNKINNSDTARVHTEEPDNSTSKYIISDKNNTEKINFLQRGTLVDHESWENIVQAAPVMAVVLNKSERFSNNSRQGTEDLHKSNKEKRHIHALEVESSRPRNMITKHEESIGTETQYQFSDLQDLAGLVELEDDEIAGRLALRYLRNYVGSALFNICDFQEAKSRQVFLFNASRIVIAVNNFTLEGMTLVLTPARSLLGSMSLCEPGYLECQIIGSRVCIDSMNACDAVPNCGSYDIYDEDRLMCGVTKGLQHNVYLAAFTFLAVILTMLYTIHYWLKRCVPKVSDAFFIYTDATENTLFLETIMRSPNEGDETSYKFAYPGHFFATDILYGDGFEDDEPNENFCKRIIRKCCAFLFCIRRSEEHANYVNKVSSTPLDQSNMLSFAEYELRKIAQMSSREEAVQTGESLEMQSIIYEKEKKKLSADIEQDPLDKLKAVHDKQRRDKYTDELKLIKFTKDSRSSTQRNSISIEQKDLGKMARRHAIVAEDEKEIQSTVYDHVSDTNPNPEDMNLKKIRVKCEVHTEKPKKQYENTKRLRFDEELTMIPSLDTLGETTINSLDNRSILTGGHNNQDLDMITQVEPETSDTRDFMRFWGTSKDKKGKKKKKKLLSPH